VYFVAAIAIVAKSVCSLIIDHPQFASPVSSSFFWYVMPVDVGVTFIGNFLKVFIDLGALI
jgi:hypothetical protein